MACSSLQPQILSLRQPTHTRLWSSSRPIGPRPAPHRADNVTRKRKRAVCPHPSWSFPAAVTPIRTSAEIRNPHSQPSWPAGSCMRGFRTPADTRNPSPCQPLREALALPGSRHPPAIRRSWLRKKGRVSNGDPTAVLHTRLRPAAWDKPSISPQPPAASSCGPNPSCRMEQGGFSSRNSQRWRCHRPLRPICRGHRRQ